MIQIISLKKIDSVLNGIQNFINFFNIFQILKN
jgi:hypothetical protein